MALFKFWRFQRSSSGTFTEGGQHVWVFPDHPFHGAVVVQRPGQVKPGVTLYGPFCRSTGPAPHPPGLLPAAAVSLSISMGQNSQKEAVIASQ